MCLEKAVPVGIRSEGDEPLFGSKPDENEAPARCQSVDVGKATAATTIPDHEPAGGMARHRLVFGRVVSAGALRAGRRDVSDGPLSEIVARPFAGTIDFDGIDIALAEEALDSAIRAACIADQNGELALEDGFDPCDNRGGKRRDRQ